MKNNKFITISSLALILTIIMAFVNVRQEPWKPEQLLSPYDLAAVIKTTANEKPLIVCVGPSAMIPGSIDAGAAHDQQSLNKLKSLLLKEKKDRQIVIYCGCCPFERCPNVRPAFKLLNEMEFTNQKLLNLPHNLKTDWIDQGYPVNN